MATIVVGVDGSEESINALRWAAEEAALRGAGLRAVICWDPYVYTGFTKSGGDATWDQVRRDSLEALEVCIAEAIDDPVLSAATERLAIEGHPVHSLRELSKSADLLVVGARGRGGIVGMLVGSTADQIVRHAHCPVIVVPGSRP